MTTEAPIPRGEQQQLDPVQDARRAFNNELFGREYSGNSLVDRTIQLQNALLGSNLTPERVYHELSIVAGQGAEKAAISQDENTASTLRDLKKGFELTYETFKPRSETQVSTPPQPTLTATLPSMTGAKGGEASVVAGTRRTQYQAVTAATSPEASATNQEETVGSFLKQKRTEARLSQVKLGQAAGGITGIKISGLENGRPTVDLNGVGQLISALGLNENDAQKVLDLYNKQFPQNPQQ